MKRFTGGHITARPYFLLEQPGSDDVSGVIAGTMNHVGPYPRMELTLDNCKITKIDGGDIIPATAAGAGRRSAHGQPGIVLEGPGHSRAHRP
jgi:hypothetical protein